jgi:hypothetical protein
MPWLSEQRRSEIRARMAPVQAWLAPRIEQGRHWLIAPREPLTWAALRSKLTTLKLPSTYAGRLAVLGVIVLLLLPVLSWYARPQPGENGAVTYPHASLINPILGGLGAIFLIYAAIQQAQIAANRHAAQTNADLQRRITETFSKAVEQLGNERVEVRVGGIYTLERLAGEALASPAGEGNGPDLYWTVMETLTAFVRERARWEEPEPSAPGRVAQSDLWQTGIRSNDAAPRLAPPTDIAAVLEVIRRRPDAGRKLEFRRGWRFDLRRTDLRGANLREAYLETANLRGAHLEGADLIEAHLEWADLRGAHLEGAALILADLEGTYLMVAHLEGANLSQARLGGSVIEAIGDAKTRLPEGVARPTGWPAYAPD